MHCWLESRVEAAVLGLESLLIVSSLRVVEVLLLIVGCCWFMRVCVLVYAKCARIADFIHSSM
jgi:hypothetical protein